MYNLFSVKTKYKLPSPIVNLFSKTEIHLYVLKWIRLFKALCSADLVNWGHLVYFQPCTVQSDVDLSSRT